MFNFREVRASDAAAVAALHNACLKGTPWSENLYKEEFSDKSKHYVVAEQNGELLGFAGFAQILDEAHIMNVAVSLAVRRQGVATRLLKELLVIAAKLGATVATLEVRVSNKPAVALYERLGFASLGVRPGYYDGGEGAEIMTKRL